MEELSNYARLFWGVPEMTITHEWKPTICRVQSIVVRNCLYRKPSKLMLFSILFYALLFYKVYCVLKELLSDFDFLWKVCPYFPRPATQLCWVAHTNVKTEKEMFLARYGWQLVPCRFYCLNSSLKNLSKIEKIHETCIMCANSWSKIKSSCNCLVTVLVLIFKNCCLMSKLYYFNRKKIAKKMPK